MKKLLLIAVCLLLLVSLCACNANAALYDSDAVVASAYTWSPLISYIPEGQILCKSSGYIYELYAREGSFRIGHGADDQQLVDALVIEGEGDAYWTYHTPKTGITDASDPWQGIETYVEIYIKSGNQYVGYAVAKIERPEDQWNYKTTILACKLTADAREIAKESLQEEIHRVIENDQ